MHNVVKLPNIMHERVNGNLEPEAYAEACHISKMECFAKIVICWQAYEYVSRNHKKSTGFGTSNIK